MRELRNQGGHVLDRVLAGERVTITRDGEPVAELVPIRRRPLSSEALVELFRGGPPLDPDEIRADIDALIDQRL